MVVLAVFMGLVIGLTLGAMGGGGSILTLPALVYVLRQDAHGATTASLIVVGATASAGALAHMRRGSVRVREGIAFGALGIVGSIAGSRLSTGIPSAPLLVGFSLVMVGAAAAMFVRSGLPVARAYSRAGESAPDIAAGLGSSHPAESSTTRTRPRPLATVATASAVGLLTGFFGVGGGFVVVPALVLVMGFDMAEAVATSLLVIAVNSGAALVARTDTAVSVDWTIVGVFAVAAVGASVLGSRVAGTLEPRRIARAFSILLVAVALYTMVRSLLQL